MLNKERTKENNIINNVGILFEELKMILCNDDNFIIKNINDNVIVIKTLKKESFHLGFIMGKIFGFWFPHNCKFKLNIRYKQYNNKSCFIFDFIIKTDKNFYEGKICVYLINKLKERKNGRKT